MRDVTETVARAIWRASALNLSGERDLDAEFDAFSEYDKADRCAIALKLARELAAAGFVIVPRKPTPEMIIAAAEAGIEYSTRVLGLENTVVSQGPHDHWIAMLNAAPKIGDDDDRS